MSKNKPEVEKDEDEIPANFPDNVEPTKENVKAFKDQAEKDRKAIKDGEDPAFGERLGEGLGDPTVNRQPSEPAHQSKAARGQTKTVSE